MTFRISPQRIGLSNVISPGAGATRVALPHHLRRQLYSAQPIHKHASYTRHQSFATTSPKQRLVQDATPTSEDVTLQPAPGKGPPSTAPASTSKRIQQPLSSLLQAHPSHDSLATYLTFARRSALNPTRHTYLGTRYEYLTQTALPRLGFELLRIGKTGDKGVDLVGRWHLPSPSYERHAGQGLESGLGDCMKVLVQCKRIAGKKKLGPSVVREMDGAFLGAPAGWKGENVVGVIVSTKPATKGVISALQASRRGLVWVCLEEFEDEVDEGAEVREEAEVNEESERAVEDEVEEKDVGEDEDEAIPTQYTYGSVHGRVVQLLYNGAAQRMGLEGLDVVKRHDQQDESTAPSDGIVLRYRGCPVPEHNTSND